MFPGMYHIEDPLSTQVNQPNNVYKSTSCYIRKALASKIRVPKTNQRFLDKPSHLICVRGQKLLLYIFGSSHLQQGIIYWVYKPLLWGS